MPHVQAGELRLYYEEAGSGEPLLLLPGLGMRVEHWAPHLPAFAAKRRVIALDVRGGADSDGPPGPYTVEQMAADTAAALDALEIGRADVLGFSMGGFIASRFAAEYPSRVRRLVLALTALRPSARGRERLRVEAALREHPELHELHFRELFLWMFDDATYERKGAIDRIVSAALSRVDEEPIEGVRSRVAACLAHDATDFADNISAPTLVIGGHNDLIYPPEATRALAAAIPGAEHCLLDCAHALTGPAIRAFDEAVVEFIGRG